MTRRPVNPPGRPSKINQPVATGPDGQPITAADRILQSLRIGDYFETACAAAGVHKETAYGWLRIGADATARTARADALKQPAPKLTAHEQRCQAFSDGVAAATAEWHRGALAQVEALARGQVRTRTTTTKRDAAGNVLEVTERVDELPPNAAVLMWRLERRLPEHYSRRFEVTVTEGWDDDERAAGVLADELAAFTAGAVAALEVSGRESNGSGVNGSGSNGSG